MVYNREKAVAYAKKWAYKRNPKYYNFDSVGGDCTSFVSQCLYAGSGVMNYTKNYGWYYIDGNNKSPSWSGVEYLYKFLKQNKGKGPYGKEVEKEKIQVGDIAQLLFQGESFGHTLLIVEIEKDFDLDKIKIASHTFDNFGKAILDYSFRRVRFIHIDGVRE